MLKGLEYQIVQHQHILADQDDSSKAEWTDIITTAKQTLQLITEFAGLTCKSACVSQNKHTASVTMITMAF